jgi:drug/metabolite transporter (DMT)-like permease
LVIDKKYLFFINLSVGITLAIQALLHPTLDPQTKTSFIIVAVVFINWAIFTWLAYSVAIREHGVPFISKLTQNRAQVTTKEDWKLLLNISTIVNQVVILLALIFMNVLIFLEVPDRSYLIGTIVVAITLPLLVTLFANHRLNRL